jgi:hypothetical protein
VGGALQAARWAVDGNKPALALVSLSKPEARLSSLINRKALKGQRVWMSFPELSVLSECAETRIERLFVAEEHVTAATAFPRAMPALTAMDHASISSGLFAETFLAAACEPAAHGSLARSMESRGIPGYSPYPASVVAMMKSGEGARVAGCSPRTAWLSSSARIHAFVEAAKLAANDFDVIGYGISHVVVGLRPDDLMRLGQYLARTPELSLPARFGRLLREMAGRAGSESKVAA